MRVRSRPGFLVLAVAALLTVLASAPGSHAASGRARTFARGGLSPSGGVVLQQEMMPARVSRLAVRNPGSAAPEFWAIGTSLARIEGWPGRDDRAGQVVFLRRIGTGAWELVGPPLNERGTPINPKLAAFDVASNGEGWAVGEGGVILHKAASSNRWVSHEASSLTGTLLTSVSIVPMPGGRTAGFAVGVAEADGQGPVILRLEAGAWRRDTPATVMAANQIVELAGVAAVSDEEAWAVSSSSADRLRIFHHTSSGWQRIATNQVVFDEPPSAGPNGGVNDAAYGSAIAADAGGAWIGGSMFPASALKPEGDTTPADRSRPFVIRATRSGDVTSFCPDQYEVRVSAGSTEADQTKMCDEPFPTSSFDISSIEIMGNEVFAAGLGLFRFTGEGWHREPNSNGYLISIAMASASEGWLASTGNTYGAGGTLRSSATTLGHWTKQPSKPSISRWPQPQGSLHEGVALDPAGSGTALAVGASASIYLPGTGWDSIDTHVGETLHAISWPRSGDAWAVGERGVIIRFDGTKWLPDRASQAVSYTLFGVAFRSAIDGVAVGAGGTILRYDGRAWSEDPSSRRVTRADLYAVAPTPGGYVAVGRSATVLELAGSRWMRRGEIPGIATRPQEEGPSLYAVATAADGRVLVGGAGSVLLDRPAGGAFRVFSPPVEGTILALALGGTVSAPVILASVSPDEQKLRGETIAVTRGALMADDGGVWRDVSLDQRASLFPGTDTAAFSDPIHAIAVEPGATRGWAAGGTPAEIRGQEGHQRSLQTSAVYRVDLGGDPRPAVGRTTPKFPEGGVAFAAFGESWCERGLCSALAGTGTMADLVPIRVREEINAASLLESGPRFAVFTGNMRSLGLPEELAQFKSYLGAFRIPVFVAIGSRDLVRPIGIPAVAGLDVRATTDTASGANSTWKEIFGDMPQPWGSGRLLGAFRPVAFNPPGPVGELARTHYAFDYVEAGRPLLRVAVIDSSTRSYGTASDQNPQEPQGAWLRTVLTGARLTAAIPSVVVMNEPTILPGGFPHWREDAQGDAQDFEDAVAGAGVSAVVAGGARVNGVDAISRPPYAPVPLYVVGGGGGPLGFENRLDQPSKLPTDGFYHAWNLINVDVGARDAATGQAPTSVVAMPVLEFVSAHAYPSRRVPAGSVVELLAFGRGLPGGWSDPEQARASHLVLGSRNLLECPGRGQGRGACQSKNALRPSYSFTSLDPEIAQFVVPDLRSVLAAPRRVGQGRGVLLVDPGGSFGVLCAIKPGLARILVEVGYLKAELAVRVTGGDGPCRDTPITDPPNPPPSVVQPRVVEPAPGKPPPRFEFAPRLDTQSLSLLAPPPAPAVAPAPPGAPGIGRKEEHEASHETEGHGATKRYAFSPLRSREPDAAALAWPMLGAVALMAFAGALVAAQAERRRSQLRASEERR